MGNKRLINNSSTLLDRNSQKCVCGFFFSLYLNFMLDPLRNICSLSLSVMLSSFGFSWIREVLNHVLSNYAQVCLLYFSIATLNPNSPIVCVRVRVCVNFKSQATPKMATESGKCHQLQRSSHLEKISQHPCLQRCFCCLYKYRISLVFV